MVHLKKEKINGITYSFQKDKNKEIWVLGGKLKAWTRFEKKNKEQIINILKKMKGH